MTERSERWRPTPPTIVATAPLSDAVKCTGMVRAKFARLRAVGMAQRRSIKPDLFERFLAVQI